MLNDLLPINSQREAPSRFIDLGRVVYLIRLNLQYLNLCHVRLLPKGIRYN